MKIKLIAKVSVERDVDVFDEDEKQLMFEELCDSCVGQIMDSSKYVVEE